MRSRYEKLNKLKMGNGKWEIHEKLEL